MNNLDELFKRKLHEPQQAPEESWEYIQAQLRKKSKKPFPIWYWISGISACFFIGFLVYQNSSKETPTLAKNAPVSVVSQQEKIIFHTPKNTTSSQHKTSSAPSNKIATSSYTDNSLKEKSTFLTKIGSIIPNPAYALEKESSLESQENTSTIIENSPNQDIHNTQQAYTPLAKEAKKEKVAISPSREKIEKFGISAYYSPSVLQAFQNQSMLSADLDTYEVGKTNSQTYGAKIDYAINDKIKIRTGVGLMNIEQKSRNVPMQVQVMTPMSLSTFEEFPQQTEHNIRYQNNLRIGQSNPQQSNINTLNKLSPNIVGTLNQKLQFVEIPLEAEIEFLQLKKLNFNAVVGGSTYILTHNSISALLDNNLSQNVGTATNINSSSFSANAGIKIDYEIAPQLKLNFEPNARWMIKPINELQKGQPFIMGLSTGISFSF